MKLFFGFICFRCLRRMLIMNRVWRQLYQTKNGLSNIQKGKKTYCLNFAGEIVRIQTDTLLCLEHFTLIYVVYLEQWKITVNESFHRLYGGIPWSAKVDCSWKLCPRAIWFHSSHATIALLYLTMVPKFFIQFFSRVWDSIEGLRKRYK